MDRTQATTNTMTDEELDRDWKPSGRRPQSTIARSFSQELMDIFRIENSVADLDEQVNKRKWQLNKESQELEALEARIREMEERLKNPSPPRNTAANPISPNNQRASSGSPRHPRAPVGNVFGHQAGAPAPMEKDYPHRGAAQKAPSRPGTARASQQAVPGALPPTPTASEDGDGEHDA